MINLQTEIDVYIALSGIMIAQFTALLGFLHFK